MQEAYEKFHAIEEEKQQRILSAAMAEFTKGYKQASTDNIVREAGISKGLLFHYFGTKEGLYRYLVQHMAKTLQDDFIGLLNTTQPDILEAIWQMSLLKHDISKKHPALFDFATSAYLDQTKNPELTNELFGEFMTKRTQTLSAIYANADLTLFKEDIDPKKAIDIINWAMQGYGDTKTTAAKITPAGTPKIRENYDSFLEEFKEYITILRACFYS
ncbi:MAG: TetR/AcrR family transcriptional regulator [Defluviitaleaceae bacterium]|nr:TetR/AcrR family transcriptional regulator [Defluviitaleaceae bacterium]